MAYIVDNYQNNKLKEKNIKIKTKYIVGNKILERNTDNSHNDDIKSGIIFEKQYYLNNELKLQETDFDSRIEYTFISNELENKDYICPNCGMESKIKNFTDGCLYCKTYYNLEYTNKDLGSKYHYDRVLKNNTYRIVTFIIDLIISILISYIFIRFTSRTFNNIDIFKIFIYGLILSLILYYFFYLLDAYVILTPIKIYKDKMNQKQREFWNNTKLDKKKFYNNLNYELAKYYFKNDNIIDYDILDYLKFESFNKDNNLFIKVILEIRVIEFINNKLSSKIIKEVVILRKNNNDVLEVKNGVNLIKCHNCGASIDINKGFCDYCHSEIKYLQEWILDSVYRS